MRRRSTLALALLPILPLALAACGLFPAKSEGEKLWRRLCAECHGLDGAGNTPRYMGNPNADLRDASWSFGGDRSSIENVVRDGIFGQMPANDGLTAAEMTQLIDYLYALRGERG